MMAFANTPTRAGNGLFFVLLPTLDCNLRCTYCFEEHPTHRWDIRQTHAVIREIFELLDRTGATSCRLHWQGGEPLLLGHKYWETVLPFAEEIGRATGIRVRQSMQTNLVLYQSEFADLVHEFLGGELGTSFEPSNQRRTLDGNHGLFKQQWIAAHGRAVGDGVEVGVLCLLNEDALRLGARKFLNLFSEESGISKIRLTLPFRQNGKQGRGYWLDPLKTGRFLAEAYDLWSEKGGDAWMEIRPFAHLADRLAGNRPETSGLCTFDRNCAEIAMSILPDGEVTLCDSFAHGKSRTTYGNMFNTPLTEIFEGEARRAVNCSVGSLVNARCTSCRYLGMCFGGCLARSYSSGPGEPVRDHYCEAYKLLFETIEARQERRGFCIK